MPQKNSFPRLVLLLALLASAATWAQASDPKVEAQVVGPAPGNPPSYHLSRGGVSVASLTMKGSRSVVVVNGEEGPLFDELLTTLGDRSLTCVNAVLFSPDGQSHAYAVRIGDEYVVVRDGKEIYRGPFANRALAGGTGQLTMSPRGKHVSFLEKVDVSASQHGWRLVVDGKAGPLSSNNNSFRLFFSPDDSRWAYVATKLNGKQDEMFTVLDGKEVPHLGHLVSFTPTNKVVVAGAGADGVWTLFVDGKPVVKGLSDPERKVWLAPAGASIAAAIRKPGGAVALWIDGSEISAAGGAKDIVDVAFSPDGKRYLAVCQTGSAHFAVTDGKKSQEYRLINWPQFTKDSSRAIFVASAGSKNFVVVDGQESDGFEIIGGQYVKIAMPRRGPHFAYSTGDGMNRIFTVVVDTQPIALNNKSPVADSLAFSADGSRYAFAAADVGRSEINTLFVDGQPVPNFYPGTILQGAPNTAQREVYFVFSPDGKHIAYYGVDTTSRRRGLFVDQQLVYPTERGLSRVAFTPDGQHLVWASALPGKGSPVPGMGWFVDGVLAAEIPGYPLDQTGTWEMSADGVYQFATLADGALKRYRLTPPGDTDVAAMITRAAAAQAQAIADATAAKAKAEADALAAKEKAAADKAAAAAKAKADYEAAQAKRKADYAAAVAAKAKARQDAIDAKNARKK